MTIEDHFPRIESIRDNIGNLWVANINVEKRTGMILHPGDELEFVITASDPLGEILTYCLSANYGQSLKKWQKNNSLAYIIKPNDIGKYFSLFLAIKSSRKYHAHDFCDAFVQFNYTVLPKNN